MIDIFALIEKDTWLRYLLDAFPNGEMESYTKELGPQFTHDCGDCVFIGRHEREDPIQLVVGKPSQKNIDMWCHQGKWIILRWASRPENNDHEEDQFVGVAISDLVSGRYRMNANHPFNVAVHLARRKGLTTL